MTAPCGKIRIPINESSDDKSQIEEFIREYKGEGIQHIALTTDNIYETVRTLRQRGMDFMPTPDTYYERVNARVEGHTEDLEQLKTAAYSDRRCPDERRYFIAYLYPNCDWPSIL